MVKIRRCTEEANKSSIAEIGLNLTFKGRNGQVKNAGLGTTVLKPLPDCRTAEGVCSPGRHPA